jgi:hypothetical protein
MGGIVRMERCTRFIKEFGDEYVKAMNFAPPWQKSQGLGVVDGYDVVKFFHTVVHSGRDLDLSNEDWGVIYDPEGDDDINVSYTAESLRLDEAVVRERFQKAGLLMPRLNLPKEE